MMTEAPTIPVPLDEFGQQAKDRLVKQIADYNDKARLVKAAEGDPQALLDELRKNSDNADVVKIREKIDELTMNLFKLEQARDEILKPEVEAYAANAKEKLGDAPEQLAKMGKIISTARKYLAETYCPEVLHDLPALEGKRSGGNTGGGSGQRRIRGFEFFVDGVLATTRDAQGNESSNAAAAAKKIGVTTDDIRQAFWHAAGTDDSSKYPNTVEFKVTVSATEEGKDATVYAVVAKRAESDETAAA